MIRFEVQAESLKIHIISLPFSIPALLKDLSAFFRRVQASSKRKCIVPFVLGGCPNLRLAAKEGHFFQWNLSSPNFWMFWFTSGCHRLLVRPYRLRAIFRLAVFYESVKWWKRAPNLWRWQVEASSSLTSVVTAEAILNKQKPQLLECHQTKQKKFEMSFRFGSITDWHLYSEFMWIWGWSLCWWCCTALARRRRGARVLTLSDARSFPKHWWEVHKISIPTVSNRSKFDPNFNRNSWSGTPFARAARCWALLFDYRIQGSLKKLCTKKSVLLQNQLSWDDFKWQDKAM